MSQVHKVCIYNFSFQMSSWFIILFSSHKAQFNMDNLMNYIKQSYNLYQILNLVIVPFNPKF